MTEQGQEWSALMDGVQEHMRRNAKLSLLELKSSSKEQGVPLGEIFAMAEPEILRAFELVAPSLFVDFLMENAELLSQSGLDQWAAKRV